MKKNKRGFTLVELVIVIAVIAILASVLLPSFLGMVKNARRSTDSQMADGYSKEIFLYKASYENYALGASEVRHLLGKSTIKPTSVTGNYWFDQENYKIIFSTPEELKQKTVSAAGREKTVFEEIIPGYQLLDTDSILGKLINDIKNISTVQDYETKLNSIKKYTDTCESDLKMTKEQYSSMLSHLQKFDPKKTLYVNEFGYVTNAIEVKGNTTNICVDNVVFANDIVSIPAIDINYSTEKLLISSINEIVVPFTVDFLEQNNMFYYIDRYEETIESIEEVVTIDTSVTLLNKDIKTQGDVKNAENKLISEYLLNKNRDFNNLKATEREDVIDYCTFEISLNDSVVIENGDDKHTELSIKINIPQHEEYNQKITSHKYRYLNTDDGQIKIDVKVYDEYGILYKGTTIYPPKIEISNFLFNNGTLSFSTPNLPTAEDTRFEYRLYIKDELVATLDANENKTENALAEYALLEADISNADYIDYITTNSGYSVYSKSTDEIISQPVTDLYNKIVDGTYYVMKVNEKELSLNQTTTYIYEYSKIFVNNDKLQEYFYRSHSEVEQEIDGEWISNNIDEQHIVYERYIYPSTIPVSYLTQNIDDSGEPYNTLESRIELYAVNGENEYLLASNKETFGTSSSSIRLTYYSEDTFNTEIAKYNYSYTFRNPLYYTLSEDGTENVELLMFKDKNITEYRKISDNCYEFKVKGTENNLGEGIAVVYESKKDYFDTSYIVTYSYDKYTGYVNLEITSPDNLYTLYGDEGYNLYGFTQRWTYEYSADRSKVDIDQNTEYSLKMFNNKEVGIIDTDKYSAIIYSGEEFNPLTTIFEINGKEYNANILGYTETTSDLAEYDVLYIFNILDKEIRIYCTVKTINVTFEFFHSEIESYYDITKGDNKYKFNNTEKTYSLECTYNEIITLEAMNFDESSTYGFVAWYSQSNGGDRIMISTSKKTNYIVPLNDVTITCEYATNPFNNDVLVFTYTASSYTCKLSWCNDKNVENLYIPSYSDGYKVTSIENNVFSGCYNLKTIYIPDTITSISDSAFAKSNLEPDTTSGIYLGRYMYKYVDNGTDTYYIKDGTEIIGNSCFKGNENIKYIYMPDSVKTINTYAFSRMTNLEYIYLNSTSSLKTIGTYAFYYSMNFKGFIINGELATPQTLEVVDSYAFYMCKSIETFDIANIKTLGSYCFAYCIMLDNISLENDKLTAIGAGAFQYCSSLTNVTIGENIVTINGSAFSYCTQLIEIVIPNSVTTFGTNIFLGCISLKEVTMPTLATIPEGMFNTCYVLERTNIDFTKVIAINKNAFANCRVYDFGNIVIGSTSSKDIVLGDGCFTECYGLTGATIKGTWKSKTLPANVFKNCVNLKTVSLNGITETGANVFSGCEKLETITGLTLTTIPDAIFYNCKNLKTKVITNFTNYTSIGKQAFYNCEKYDFGNLVLGTLTNDLEIGANAFTSCMGIGTLKINAKTLTFMGGSIFTYCYNMKSVEVNATTMNMGSTATATSIFSSCTALKTAKLNVYKMYTYRGKTTSILPASTFVSCPALTEVVLPYNVTEFGNDIFKSCTVLKNITKYYEDTFEGDFKLTKVGTNVFTSTTNFVNDATIVLENGFLINKTKTVVYAYLGTSKEVTLPSTVTTIFNSAFANTKLIETFTIDNEITEVQDYAFANSTISRLNITQSTLPTFAVNSLENINEEIIVMVDTTLVDAYRSMPAFENLYINNSTAFNPIIESNVLVGYTGTPINVVLPSNVTQIKEDVFKDCLDILTIEMPGVTIIGNGAFSGCTNLTSVVMTKVMTIGDYAFSGCTQLNFTLPTTLKTIGESAFNGNNTTTEIIIYQNVTSIGSNAFTNSTISKIYSLGATPATVTGNSFATDVTIIVPNGYISTYKESWSDYQSNVKSDTDVTYTLNSGTLSNYIGSVSTLDLSNEMITAIADNTFKGNTSLTTIILPKSINSIGKNVFNGCTNLTTISFVTNGTDNNLTTINDYAFNDCSKLTTINGIDLSTVKNLGNYAFKGCSKLNGTFTLNLTTAGTNIFKDCKALTSITINEIASKKLTDNMFDGCTSLNKVIVPTTLTTFGAYTFRNCSKLTKICYSDESFYDFSNATSIGTYAFANCTVLELGDISLQNNYVNSFGRYAFQKCNKLTSVTFLNGTTTSRVIQDYIFVNCTGLISVSLSTNITQIGTQVFNGCTNLKQVYTTGQEPVENAIILDNVITLSGTTFKNCDTIKYIYINKGTFTTNVNSFENMDNLITVTLSAGTKLGNNVFKDCKKLETINGLDNVTSYGSTVFNACVALKVIDLGESTSIASNCFSGASYLEKVIAPNVTVINASAFYNCVSLKEVEIDFEKVTTIGNSAFYNCMNLEFKNYRNKLSNELIIGSEGETLSLGTGVFYQTFQNKQLIDTITFKSTIKDSAKNTLNRVPDSTFQYAISLKNINFENSIVQLGNNVFNGALSLENITNIDFENLSLVGTNVFNNCKRLNLGEITIGANISSSTYMFTNVLNLTKVTINYPITIIPSNIFNGCVNLEEVILDENSQLTKIDTSAFSTCVKLRKIYNLDLENISNIGNSAFQNCKLLEWDDSITISNSSVKNLYLGSSAFSGNLLLNNVVIGATNISTITSSANNTLNTSAFADCYNLKTIVLPETLKILSNSVFQNNISLTNIYSNNIGTNFDYSNLTSIGNSAFINCLDLTYNNGKLTLGKLTTMGTKIFQNNLALREVEFTDTLPSNKIPDETFRYDANIERVTLLSTIINISHYAFAECYRLTEISTLENLTTIGNYAFDQCTKLTIDLKLSKISSLGTYAFRYCENITSVDFTGSTLTKVDNYVFAYCYNLESVTMTNKIVTINQYAFADCYVLNGIDISNVKTLGVYAFSNCQSITTLTFNDNLTTVSQYAFQNNVSLKEIKFNKTSLLTKIDKYAFYGCVKLRNVVLPKGVNTINDSAFARCTTLSLVYFDTDTENALSINTTAFNYTKVYYVFNTNELRDYYKTSLGSLCLSKTLFNEEAYNYGFVIAGTTLIMYEGEYKDIVIDGSSIKFRKSTSEDYTQINVDVSTIYYYCFSNNDNMIKLDIDNSIYKATKWSYKNNFNN